MKPDASIDWEALGTELTRRMREHTYALVDRLIIEALSDTQPFIRTCCEAKP